MLAAELYSTFVDMVRESYERERVKDGVFGALMDVELINDGPVRASLAWRCCCLKWTLQVYG